MPTQNSNIDRVVAYLDALGIKVDIKEKYNDRVKVQKVAFLMQTLVGELNYTDFIFHMKGPYSHQLTVDYFENEEKFHSKPTYVPDDREKQLIERISVVMGNDLGAENLEVTASLLFLHSLDNLDFEASEIELSKRKPHLPEEAIWHGSNVLKSLLLSEQERDAQMKAVAKETESLDKASCEDLQKFA